MSSVLFENWVYGENQSITLGLLWDDMLIGLLFNDLPRGREKAHATSLRSYAK